MTPLLIMVGADKGGVGKTTISRTLLEYLTAQGSKFRAFDTETPNGVLKRFNSNDTEMVDLTTSDGQMKVFDTLEKTPITVIDIRAGLLSPTLETMLNVGLLDMVKSKTLNLAVMHVLGPTLASLAEIKDTAEKIPTAHYFLVKNHINNSNFFEWDKVTTESIFSDPRSGTIDIPKLDELAMENVEKIGVTFKHFIENETNEGAAASYSLVLRGYVRTWLKKIYAEFDRIKLNELTFAH